MRMKFDERVLEVLEESIDPGDKSMLQTRIVSWNNGKPKLEVRHRYQDENNSWQPGKLTGLTVEDVQMIMDKGDDIVEKMLSEEANKR